MTSLKFKMLLLKILIVIFYVWTCILTGYTFKSRDIGLSGLVLAHWIIAYLVYLFIKKYEK